MLFLCWDGTQAGKKSGISHWDAPLAWKVGADLRGMDLEKELHHFSCFTPEGLNVLAMHWLQHCC